MDKKPDNQPGVVQALKHPPMPAKLMVDREKRLSSITEVSRETMFSHNASARDNKIKNKLSVAVDESPTFNITPREEVNITKSLNQE